MHITKPNITNTIALLNESLSLSLSLSLSHKTVPTTLIHRFKRIYKKKKKGGDVCWVYLKKNYLIKSIHIWLFKSQIENSIAQNHL